MRIADHGIIFLKTIILEAISRAYRVLTIAYPIISPIRDGDVCGHVVPDGCCIDNLVYYLV